MVSMLKGYPRISPLLTARYTCAINYNYHYPSSSFIFKRAVHNDTLLELILVRHGESEGNIAYRRSQKGDRSLSQSGFLQRHSSKWRLTNKGRAQADTAGQYLRENFPQPFDKFYVSEYLRAMETATRLDLPGAEWYPEVFLREQDWGQMDILSQQQRQLKMADELQRANLESFLLTPPGGESMADVALRVDRFLTSLRQNSPAQRAVVVCHGEIMWAIRFLLERMNLMQYQDLYSSRRMTDHIHNGHVLIYTRINPVTKEIVSDFKWMKSVCPWDMGLSTNKWQEVEQPHFTNGMLLAMVDQVPRMISGEEEIKEDVQLEKKSELTNAQTSTTQDTTSQTIIKGAPLKFKKVLVVSKITRLETEQQAYGGISQEELRKVLSVRGIVYDRLKRSHDAHSSALENIVNGLKEFDVDVKVTKVNSVKPSDYNGVDLVITAGGDGTFLKASSFLYDGNIPMLGVNTDPGSSFGFLCENRIERHDHFNMILDNILSGNFTFRRHNRLRIKLLNSDGVETIIPQRVLNEVFFAEADPSRPSVLKMGVDNLKRETVRSSGVIISSGTGSTAWFESATKIHQETIKDVLKHAGIDHDETIVAEVMHKINRNKQKLPVFSPNPQLAFVVREPIINTALGGCMHRIGYGKSVTLQSLGWYAKLTIDGIATFPFEYGVQAIVEASSTDEDVIKSIVIDPKLILYPEGYDSSTQKFQQF